MLAQQAEPRVVPLDRGLVPSVGHVADRDVVAGDEALRAGLASLAERFYRRALEGDSLGDSGRQEVQLRLATALITQGRAREAKEVLSSLPNAALPAVRLRVGFVAQLEQDGAALDNALNGLKADMLPPTDRPWLAMLEGLRDERRGQTEAAQRLYEEAKRTAASPAERAQFDATILRAKLLHGRATEAMAQNLKERMESYRGQRVGFNFAREYAVALVQLGKRDEALAVVDQQLRSLSPAERDEIDQMLVFQALVEGEDTPRAQFGLKDVVQRGSNRRLQEIALQLLARSRKTAEDPLGFQQMLDELIRRPVQHPLLEVLILHRANLALRQGQLDEAETLAQRLLEQFPASTARGDAMRLLACVAWRRDPPRLRTAADYLNRLRGEMAPGLERRKVGGLVGDLYFLNSDFSSAADAYSALGAESPEAAERGPLLFRQVLAEVKAGRLDSARAGLDAAAGDPAIDSLSRWRAEWNFVTALKDAGKPEAAFARIGELLGRDAATMPADLRVRLLWLDARLALELGQAAVVPERADALLAQLREVPDNVIPAQEKANIAAHVQLLKGQALLARRDAETGFAVFEFLRREFAGSGPALLSYLTEARHYLGEGLTAKAQQRALELADKYPQSVFAAEALYEAALIAERGGLESNLREAIGILERLGREHPTSPFLFYARLKQGDLLRKLTDFGSAALVYENALARWPTHPERARAELMRADALLALSVREPTRLDEAIAALERLFDMPGAAADLRAEAGYKWGFALSRRSGNAETAREALWLVASRFMTETGLGPQGRYWVSRALFDLGGLYEKDGRQREARDVYLLVLKSNLPGRALAQAKLDRGGATVPASGGPQTIP